MASIRHITAFLALLATTTSAAPTEKRGHSFSLTQQSQGQKLKNGPADMLRTYAKYGGTVTANITSAAATVQQGQDTATPESYDEEYLCPVSVGGQTLNMDFDTGSSDFWVFSTELPSSESTGHTSYNPSKSSTSHLLSGYTWSIEYADDSTSSGNVYTDTVTIGGVTATSQAVEAAQTVSSEFVEDTANDGLVGLAFSELNTVQPTQQLTFFDNVKSTLASPLFTATLKHNAPGYYDFGYIDSSKYTGSITYTSVNTANGFWQFTASGYAVGSGSTTSSSFSAIADTGTTLLYLPQAAVTAYYKQVSGARYNNEYEAYTIPCSASLPSFTAVINGYHATVPGSYMNYQPISGNTCYGGIQPNTGLGFAVFGDVFLKSQFVVFDNPGTPQLGFAAQS